MGVWWLIVGEEKDVWWMVFTDLDSDEEESLLMYTEVALLREVASNSASGRKFLVYRGKVVLERF